MKARLEYNLGSDDFNLSAILPQASDGILKLTALEWKLVKRGTLVEPAQIIVDGKNVGDFGPVSVRTFIQTIMNVGWDQGIRPEGFKDMKNETEAVRTHLEDMRQLAFGKLHIPKPQK